MVSGIGEQESELGQLRQAKRTFLALTLIDAVAMLTHISDVLLPGGGRVRFLSLAFVTAIMLILILRGVGLRALMLGCGEVLYSVGAQALSGHARQLSRHVTAALTLLLLCLLTALILALTGIRPVPRLLLGGAALALAYYVVVFLFIIRWFRKAVDVIAAISE